MTFGHGEYLLQSSALLRLRFGHIPLSAGVGIGEELAGLVDRRKVDDAVLIGVVDLAVAVRVADRLPDAEPGVARALDDQL